MAANPSDLHLTRILSDLAPGVSPEDCHLIAEKQTGARITATFHLPTAPRDSYLKVAVNGSKTELLAREIESTRHACHMMASRPGLDAPDILGGTPDRNAFLTGTLRGMPFNTWSATSCHVHRRSTIQRIGHWFSVFHDMPAAHWAEFDAGDAVTPLLTKAKDALRGGHCAAPNLLEAIALRLDRYRREIPSLSLPHTRIHGDPNVKNILVGEDTCAVIDFEASVTQPAVLDIGGLLARLPLFPDASGEPPCPEDDMAALRAGYGPHFPAGPELALAVDMTLFWLVLEIRGPAERLRPWQRRRCERLRRRVRHEMACG